MLVPWFEGERTPHRPTATAQLAGLRLGTTTPANLARAAVEGMLCGLADGLDALRDLGVEVHRVLLIGGGARSRAVQAVAPSLLDAPVLVPPAGEYVADGAARQAAWTLGDTPEPRNGRPPAHRPQPTDDRRSRPDPPHVRHAYAQNPRPPRLKALQISAQFRRPAPLHEQPGGFPGSCEVHDTSAPRHTPTPAAAWRARASGPELQGLTLDRRLDWAGEPGER